MGGTMRLGADPVKLHEGTRAREIYGEQVIYERHRHRYEVNNHLRKRLEHAGLVCSGTSPDDRLVEIDRAARPPVLRRLPVPPGVQVAPAAPAAAVPRVRAAPRSSALARQRARGASPTVRESEPRAYGASPATYASRLRATAERARAAARRLRPPVRDREPVRARARDRRRGHGRAARRSASRSRRTTRRRRPGPTRATCSPASTGRPGRATILLCAHLDTVPLDAPVEVGARGGGVLRTATRRSSAPTTRPRSPSCWRSRAGSSRAARRSGSSCCSPPAEELALRGAKAFDPRRLRSEFGFVFDHAIADRRADRRGAHLLPDRGALPRPRRARRHPARGRPQRDRRRGGGVASLELGRLDAQTTANVGRIEGGTADNVVAERCDVELEARSLDHERAAEIAARIVDAADRRRERRRVRRRDRRRASSSAATGSRAPRRRSSPPRPRSRRLGFEPVYVTDRRRQRRQRASIAAGFRC